VNVFKKIIILSSAKLIKIQNNVLGFIVGYIIVLYSKSLNFNCTHFYQCDYIKYDEWI